MKIFLFLCLATIITSSAWANSICRQSETANFGTSVVSQSNNSFVIAQECAENRLVAKRPVSLSARISHPRVSEVTKPIVNSGSNVTVFFDFNRANLEEFDRRVMNQFSSGAKVSVTGYTCSIGSEDYNDKLSLRRAKVVARYLRSRGVTVNTINGKGECCPLSSSDLSKNRRVLVKEEK